MTYVPISQKIHQIFWHKCLENGFAILQTSDQINIANLKIFNHFNWVWRKLSKNPWITVKKEYWKFVRDNPTLKWDWSIISRQASFTLVKNNCHLPWNWDILSIREDLQDDNILQISKKYWIWKTLTLLRSWDFISNNPNLPWDWDELSRRIVLKTDQDVEVLKLTISKPWNWKILSTKVHENWKLVCTYPHKNWDWNILSNNESIDWMIVCLTKKKPWNWKLFSSRSDLDWGIIEQCIDKPWDWFLLSNQININWEFIDSHKNYNWKWFLLSCHKKIPQWFVESNINENFSFKVLSSKVDISLIQLYPDKNWNFLNFDYDFEYFYFPHTVYDNPHIKWRDIKENPHLEWNYRYVHKKFSDGQIDWDYISSNLSLAWDYSWLCRQSNIPAKFLLAYYDHITSSTMVFSNATVFRFLNLNCQLTIDFITSNLHIPWNYEMIEKNTYYRRSLAARIIQRYWRLCRYDPSYTMCEKIQMGNFQKISDLYFPSLQNDKVNERVEQEDYFFEKTKKCFNHNNYFYKDCSFNKLNEIYFKSIDTYKIETKINPMYKTKLYETKYHANFQKENKRFYKYKNNKRHFSSRKQRFGYNY